MRDKQLGVPHIYGDTRAELMFGIGYATAEDRLFMIDVLRHACQADLAQFAGAQNYVNGISAYISRARNPVNALTMMPAEYTALGQTPQPFTLEDLVSIATLVGGIFGKGGGDQLQNAVLYEGLKKRFGRERYAVAGSPEGVPAVARKRKKARGKHKHRTRKQPDHSGFATFLSLDDPSDPEAPTTVRGKSFAYQTLPAASKVNRATIALPDQGSVRFVNHIVAGAPPAGGGAPGGLTSRGKHRTGVGLGPLANAGPGLLAFPPGMSNALLVSGVTRRPGIRSP